MKHKYTTFIVLFTLFCHSAMANLDPVKYHDYRSNQKNAEVQKMQDFHLEQAKLKLYRKENTHAWGDFAYLLCHVPNHHQALQHMLTLAPQLNKESEMQGYLRKALDLYPDDAVLHMLYGAFLFNIGQEEAAKTQMKIAQALDNFIFNESTLTKN